MTSLGEGASAADLQVQVHYRLIEALQESEQRLAEAQRVANLGSWSLDLATEELTWSDQMYRVLGRNPGDGDIDWAGVLARVPDEERDRCEAFVADAIATGTPGSFDFPIVVDGEQRWLHSILAFDKDAWGRAVRLHGITQDVTAEHEARRIVEELRGRFQTIVENVSDIVTIIDRDGILRYSSPSQVLGSPIGSMYGTSILDLLHPDDAPLAGSAVDRLRRMGQGSSVDLEVRLRHADGSWRTFSSIGKNLIDDPAIGGFLFVFRDVTAERRLEHGLRHDPLTGLPNRSALGDLAEGAFARAARREWVSALLVVNLDKFHIVNDQYGYDVGDEVLIEVARRLDIAFRVSDGVARANTNVGRFAGDEFLVLCEQVDPDKIPLLWSRVDDALREPVPVGGATVSLSASVGVAVSPPARRDFTVALHEAETAVRVVKDRGGGGFALFDESLGQHERLGIEARRRLERALADGQLRLHYQPKVSLVTGRVIGSEGLLRWEDPERGLVPPLDFIPLAEETGLIVPIGAWVIEEACRQGARWEAMFPNRPPLLTCVNVSARQFGPALVDTVAAALAATGLSASRLGLEVTESALMTDVVAAADVLRRLGELGVSLAIDDFGTGYSSLAYLKQFELHELKVDKSFVDGLGRVANDSSIVAAVIALAHALDLGVVAEGVETNDQAERLRSMGCEVAQGYLFGRPAPAEAMELLLSKEATESWQQYGEVPQGGGEASSMAFRAERVLVVDDSPDTRMLARMSLAAVGFEVHEATDGRTWRGHSTRTVCCST